MTKLIFAFTALVIGTAASAAQTSKAPVAVCEVSYTLSTANGTYVSGETLMTKSYQVKEEINVPVKGFLVTGKLEEICPEESENCPKYNLNVTISKGDVSATGNPQFVSLTVGREKLVVSCWKN